MAINFISPDATDVELLEAFKRRYPKYTARELGRVLCLKRAMSFQVFQDNKLAPAQRKLLIIYLNLPSELCEKFFSY